MKLKWLTRKFIVNSRADFGSSYFMVFGHGLRKIGHAGPGPVLQSFEENSTKL
jgi:hypothetical protein